MNQGPSLELHVELQRQEPQPCEVCCGKKYTVLDPLYDGDPNEGKKVICRACEGTGVTPEQE